VLFFTRFARIFDLTNLVRLYDFVSQFSDTNPVVEGKEFVVSYQLVNMGNAVASKIDIADNYDVNRFEFIIFYGTLLTAT